MDFWMGLRFWSAAVLLVVGGYLLAGSWVILVRGLRGRRGGSPIPVLPGLSIAGALALLETTRGFWWAGLLVDPTVPSAVVALVRGAREGWRTRRLRRLGGEDATPRGDAGGDETL